MSIIYHQLRYIPNENKYIVSQYKPPYGIDTSKLTNDVIPFGQNKWIGRKKQDLIDYANATKARLIDDYKSKIDKLEERYIEVV